MKLQLQYLLLLVSSVFTYGQVSVVTEVNKKELNGKEAFTLTIVQETIGADNIQETPLRMPDLSKFNKIGEGSVRNTLVDPQTKTVINQLVYEYVLEPKQTGKVMIGSALVTVNGKIYKSEPFYINVREGDFNRKSLAENSSENVYLNIEVQNQEVYKNQPTIAVLRAYSKDFNDLRRVGKVHFPDSEDFEIKPVSFERSDIQHKSNMVSQVIAVMMILPNAEGKISIPPVSVAYNEAGNRIEKLKSNAIKLSVKKLPMGSPKSFKNAVGKFDFSISNLSKNKALEVNKPIDILVKIKGEGNINEAHLPRLINSTHYTFYKPEISSKVKNSKSGFEGEVSAHYVLVPKKTGAITVVTEAFSFFNPSQSKYINLGKKSLNLDVLSAEQISSNKSTIQKVNEISNSVLDNVHSPIISTKDLKIKNENTGKLQWKTLAANYSLIGLFLIIIAFFFSLIKKMIALKPKTQQVSLGSVEETEQKIREELNSKPNVDFESLKKLIHQEKYPLFFEEFDKMSQSIEQYLVKHKNVDLKKYFENKGGKVLSEKYNQLMHQIRIEKYSPFTTKEHLQSLISEIEILYHDFS